MVMQLAGVDLAWQCEKNPSAIAFGVVEGGVLHVTSLDQAVLGLESVFSRLAARDLHGIAIDASLIINNSSGQRPCEREIGRVYGSRGAGCHASNTTLYPDSKSVALSQQLTGRGFQHLHGDRWQIECYPHPSLIEIFNLPERLKYKKGAVEEKRSGQKKLAALLASLQESEVLRLEVGEGINVIKEAHIETLRGRALKSNEDGLDALVCLYVAALYGIKHPGRLFGDKETGYVWIPQGACV